MPELPAWPNRRKNAAKNERPLRATWPPGPACVGVDDLGQLLRGDRLAVDDVLAGLEDRRLLQRQANPGREAHDQHGREDGMRHPHATI